MRKLTASTARNGDKLNADEVSLGARWAFSMTR
jgi:hypothetical protein